MGAMDDIYNVTVLIADFRDYQQNEHVNSISKRLVYIISLPFSQYSVFLICPYTYHR